MDLTAQDNWLIARRKQIAALEKLAILIALLFSQAHAQGKPEDRVTLSIKNGTLESVLKEIRKQTGYNYALQDRWKAMAKPVDIFVKDMPVEEALTLCFKDQPFTYTIISRTIVIEERKPVEPKEPIGAAGTKPPDGISGVVLNEEGRPLAGATVEVREANMKNQTDENGAFFFSGLRSGKYELEVSFVGYEKYQMPVMVKNLPVQLSVSLKHTTGSLDEVQVIAYGTTTKRLSTGDVTTVKAAELETQPVANVLEALEGKVTGMYITQSNGFPGAAIGIQLRGLNSIVNGNNPLYIVDGVPFGAEVTNGVAPTNVTANSSLNATPEDPFSYINPADIESIDVLKDADATAIYGSRGANGVVLITTKKGKAGRTNVTLNVQSGVGQVARKLSVLDSRQYLEMRNEAFHNDGSLPNPNADFDLTLWDTTRNTSWQKTLLGSVDSYNDAEGTVSGGNVNTQFLIGAGYHKETTVFPGDFNDRKGSAHFNINNTSPNKKFTLVLSGLYTIDKNLLPGYDLTETAVLLPPDAPALYKSDGSINWAPNPTGSSSWAGNQPAAMLLPQDNESANNLVSNLVVGYKLLPGLELKSSFGYNNLQTTGVVSTPLTFFDPALRTVDQRNATYTQTSLESWIIEPQLTYQMNVSEGKLTALVGTTIQQANNNASSISATGFSNDLQLNDIAAATKTTVNGAMNSVYKYNAVFTRLTYNWRSRYLLNLTGRRDGSSRFGPANQFHDFWAVGAGWIFSDTKLAKNVFSALSFGKIRGSYGTTGSDKVGDYTFMDLYTNIPAIGVPYQGANGLAPTTIYTPNLAWEETKKLEGGLELGFLKDRIVISTGYYFNRSGNQLVPYSLPSIAGFTQVSKNLNAIVQNKGWEFELKTINIKSKNIQWTSSFNISLNRNKLASGTKGLSEYIQEKIGHPLQSYFGYHTRGVDPITGVYQFQDVHGNPTDNPNPITDLTSLIDPSPKFYGSLQNNIEYHRFQLSFLFQFVDLPQAPVYLFSSIAGSYSPLQGGGNQPVNVMKRWQNPGDVTKVERFSQNNSLQSSYNYAMASNLIYGDASYVRLKNLALSWALPENWQQKARLTNTRLFVHAQNLLLITGYKGLDPETKSAITLPPLRVITVGLNTTF